MRPNHRPRGAVALLLAACLAAAAPAGARALKARADAGRLRFVVRVAPDLVDRPVSGRLIVSMTNDPKPVEDIVGLDFLNPGSTYVAAAEVRNVAPGSTVELDPDALAFPRKFSEAPAGDYQITALLDLDHSFAYDGPGEGDLYSAVSKVEKLSPASAAPVELTLTKRMPARPTPDPSLVRVVSFESPSLSAFWGRPITMRASVVVPRSAAENRKRRYPTVYNVHGFGGSHRNIWGNPGALLDRMAKGESPEMIHVFLDGSFPTGHHEFADSANNGPWGRALTTEFIPYLERTFPAMDSRPAGRFLTGHSSGGWSTLWLQVTYPDVFGGTWSTSPDPVDFRSFTRVDLTKPESDNLYRQPDGTERNLARYKGRDLMSMREFARYELVTGDYGGQFASFEYVFSPRGPDGRPMQLFDRDTGALDPVVTKAWEKYDISKTLRDNWPRLGPKLKGKLHVIVGSDDTFHLEAAVYLLRDELQKLGSDATFEVIPGRDHMDLYEGGLTGRIEKEMYATWSARRRK